jgi:hypothetical protein
VQCRHSHSSRQEKGIEPPKGNPHVGPNRIVHRSRNKTAMGQQHNKVEKRRRQVRRLKRKKATTAATAKSRRKA